MYDAIIFAEADPEPAARTLACLVEGAVEGMLNHVVVISEAETAALATLADAAGCRLEMGITRAALPEALRRHLVTPHTLAFTAGALPQPGWTARLRNELHRRGEPHPDMSFVFRPERRSEAWKLIAHVSLRGRMPLVPRRAHAPLAARELSGRLREEPWADAYHRDDDRPALTVNRAPSRGADARRGAA